MHSISEFRENIVDALARLETKMDAVLEKDKDKETRLRSLEKRQGAHSRQQWVHSITVTIFAAVLAKIGLPLPGGH